MTGTTSGSRRDAERIVAGLPGRTFGPLPGVGRRFALIIVGLLHSEPRFHHANGRPRLLVGDRVSIQCSSSCRLSTVPSNTRCTAPDGAAAIVSASGEPQSLASIAISRFLEWQVKLARAFVLKTATSILPGITRKLPRTNQSRYFVVSVLARRI